jgi:EpsI family protein
MVGLGLCLVAALGWCYIDVARLLVGQWASNDMYSHGFLVPVIAGYVMWERREGIAASWGQPSYAAGGAVLLIGLTLLTVGRISGIGLAQQLSMLPTLGGIVLLLGGLGLLRAVWFPIIYLLAMIPFWDVFTDPLHQPFQTFSAFVGQRLMLLIGVPVLRTDTFLYLPNATLEVARACSGVHFLIAVAALAVPLAYLADATFLRRVCLVVGAVVAAILGNGVRVALIGAMLHYRLWEDIHGPGHIFQGMFVVMAGYIALFALAHRMKMLPLPRRQATPGTAERRPRSFWGGRPLATATIIVCLGIFAQPTVSATIQPSGRALPVTVGLWRGVTTVPSVMAVRGMGADTELTRTFVRDNVGTIHLYIGYFSIQRQGRGLIGYGVQLPTEMSMMALNIAGRPVTVAEGRDGSREVVYWYELNGRLTANKLQAKWFTLQDGILRGRTNGALIGVTFDPVPGLDSLQARREALAFAADIVPAIHEYLAPADVP